MMKPYSKTEAIRHLEKCGLYIMKPDNIDRFISCGVEAFSGSTLYNYFFHGKDFHQKVTLAIESLIKTTGEKGLLYADSEKVNGYAQWFPPGFSGNSLWSYIHSGGWKYLFLSDFFETLHRVDYVENFSFKRKAEITDNQDVFLYNLAVKPSMQRKGIAKKLVRPMLEYASSIGRPCYCETFEPVNIPIYKHMGFKQLRSTKLVGTPETHYPMFFKV
ncbi:hypothetical protein M9Y10_030149 [Tritrichomonas musculus]|uniref:N-acetyltransferase domain-containing protein n=1 Tax=Tritrichomonas musculus TaxID=1915356 RepID=A0ABR2KP13_9EUKA